MKARKKIRLPDYDYGQKGCYFVTVCTQDRAWYFGLPKIMDWYKTMTTNQYMRLVRQGKLPPFRKKLWQRSYHDHVIRDENS